MGGGRMLGALGVIAIAGASLIATPAQADATKAARSKAKLESARRLEPGTKAPTNAATRGKRATRALKARAAAQAEADRLDAKLDGKVAVFPFRGNDTPSLRAPVLKVLRERGFTVVTDLRPVDFAEQFRDLAAALDIVAFVEGNVTDLREKSARVTVSLRSGYSGRKVASTVMVSTANDAPGEVTDKLWQRLGPALRRARADADKPRRKTRAPMQINAGTPIENRPAAEPIRTANGKAPG